MEVANGLLMAPRRGRLTEDKTQRFLQDIVSLPIQIDAESTSQAFMRTLVLARRHKLTAYDAAYLEVAVRLSAPLATLDESLRNAAVAEGVLLPRTPSGSPTTAETRD